jgi:type I restriction enzyme S subunit
MNERREIPLGKLVDVVIDNRGKTPPISETGYELLEVNAISKERRTPDYSKVRKFVSEETYKNWFRKGHPQPGDILVPTVGTIGNVSLVNEQRGAIAQNLIALRLKNGVDSRYVYYFLSSSLGKDLMLNLDIGGVQPSIKVPHLLDMAIPIVNYEEQKAIAAVLASLDDKIDLLHHQNKTLETMAETLFRQWFVEQAEEDWEAKSLLELVELIGGGTPKTSMNEYWNGDIPWLSGGDITTNHKEFALSSEKTITKAGINNSSAKLLPKFATVISARGTVGKYCLLASDMAFSQSNYGILPKIEGCYYFTYLLVNHVVEELQSAAYGSVFDTITTSTFRDATFAIPPTDKILDFEGTIAKFLDKKLLNQTQIHTLEKLRNTLLPKLMSGEVQVTC